MITVLGIDPSLTSTGLALLDVSGDEHEWITSVVKSSPKSYTDDLQGMNQRMADICLAIDHFWGVEEVDLVVVEGLSFGSHGSATRNLAGLWWRVIDQVFSFEQGDVRVVAPATRAKYAAGNGRASKSDVLASVRDLHPTADVPGHDVADAVAMAALGARRLGFPVEARERPWLGEVAASLTW